MDHLLPSDYLGVVRRNIFADSSDEITLNRPFLKVAFPRIGYFAKRRSSLPIRIRRDYAIGVETFISHLANECDGAKTRDRRGFDQSDKTVGHKLAAKVSDQFKIHLTETDAKWALSTCIKYKGQLSKRFGLETVTDVIDNQKFLYEIVDDNCSNFILHVSLDEQNGVISFELPKDAPPSQQDGLFKEVWALLRSLDITTEPPLNDMAKKLRRSWERNCFRFNVPISCSQADLLITVLSELGYVIDQRLFRATAPSPVKDICVSDNVKTNIHAPQLSFGF